VTGFFSLRSNYVWLNLDSEAKKSDRKLNINMQQRASCLRLF